MTWINICTFIIAICTIAYGGFEDYKKREIPDMVPVILLMTGLFGKGILLRALSMLAVGAILLLTSKLTREEFPGGDFKLICALTFNTCLIHTALIMVITGIGALLVSLIKKKPLKRNIPLCTYAAPAYMLIRAADIIF